jgi:antitoxin component YwqK of YwqJK toxin-antitoxin module
LYDGQWLYFEDDGTIIGLGEYKKGAGKQKAWYRNSTLKRETSYLDNEKNGKEIWYNADGTVSKILTFEYGDIVSTEEF